MCDVQKKTQSMKTIAYMSLRSSFVSFYNFFKCILDCRFITNSRQQCMYLYTTVCVVFSILFPNWLCKSSSSRRGMLCCSVCAILKAENRTCRMECRNTIGVLLYTLFHKKKHCATAGLSRIVLAKPSASSLTDDSKFRAIPVSTATTTRHWSRS